MNPDQSSENDAKSAERTSSRQPSSGSSATDLIGTISSSPAAERSQVPEYTTPAVPVALTPEPAIGRTPLSPHSLLPVMHEVPFESSTSSERIDPLLQMLHGTPSTVKPMEMSAPMGKAEGPAALPSGGFTQLLRALNTDSGAFNAIQAETSKTKPDQTEVTKPEASKSWEPVRSAEPVPAADAAPVVKPMPISSITQLLRTIETVAAPVIAPPVTPAAVRHEPVTTQVTSFRHEAPATVPQAAPVPAVAAPVPAISALPAEDAFSFTQLFESVDVSKDVPVKAPETTTGHMGFTQMFEALGAAKGKSVRAAEPLTALSRIASEEPAAAASVPAMPIASTPPAAPGSFTQIFPSLEADADAGSKIDAPPAVAAVASPGEVAQGEASLPASATGSFTRIFRTLEAQTDVAVKGDVPSERASAPAAPVEAVISTGPTAANSPGSFTQMFRSLDAAPGVAAAPSVSPVETMRANTAAPVATPASQPGSFTQMFRSLDAASGEAAAPSWPPSGTAEASTPAPIAPPASQPGSFTQMVQSLGSSQEEVRATGAPAVRGDAGSFTELFKTPSEPKRPAVEDSFEQAYGRAGASGAGSTSPMSSSFPPAADSGYTPSAQPSQPSRMAKGGLTELLRTLNEPGARPHAAPPETLRPSGQEQPGTFTSVYGRLEGNESAPVPPAGGSYDSPAAARDATQTFHPSAAPSAPTGPLTGAAPSEFTRIINASALREGSLRSGAPAGEATHMGAAETPAAGGGMTLPGGLPAGPQTSFSGLGGAQASVSAAGGPHGSFSPPVAPHGSISGPGGAHVSVSAAGGPHASFSGPHAPAVSALSQVKLPETPKAGAPSAGVQKYLPLVLILIIFLLLAILVAMIFFMKK